MSIQSIVGLGLPRVQFKVILFQKKNKAYRPNAYLLDILVHYIIIILIIHSCIKIICHSDRVSKFSKNDCKWCYHQQRLHVNVCNILELCLCTEISCIQFQEFCSAVSEVWKIC